MDHYYRDLAFHLRMRDYSEDEVARIVEHAQRVVEGGGSTPELTLGKVADYIETFPPREASDARRSYQFAFALVAVVGVAYLVGRLFIPAIDVGYRIGLWGIFVCWALLLVAAPAWNLRRPTSRQ